MLQPACLLPAARLAPPHGLLTPRSGTEVSLQYLGPATRRSDAYRDGTLTLWTCAARSSSPSPSRVQSCLCFVTHHRHIFNILYQLEVFTPVRPDLISKSYKQQQYYEDQMPQQIRTALFVRQRRNGNKQEQNIVGGDIYCNLLLLGQPSLKHQYCPKRMGVIMSAV